MGPGPGAGGAARLTPRLDDEQRRLYQDEEAVRAILHRMRTVAIVGMSADPQKASSFVASYLRYAGWDVIPVNPRAEEILGLRCYPRLEAIPRPVELVDIFRPAADVGPIVESAIAIGARAVWQQLRIVNLEAAARARAAGLLSVVDLCVKMEHGRYSGGLHEAGMNTLLLSARREHRFV